MSEKTFASGIYFNEPPSNAPEFVLGSISIDKKNFMDFLKTQGDKIKLDILRSQKTQKPYLQVNTYQKRDNGSPS